MDNNDMLHLKNIEHGLDSVLYKELEYKAKKDAALFKVARESSSQIELLSQQLIEVKEQNSLLRENYSMLKELYSTAKQEAESNSKEARHNKIFAWVSFAVGTSIGIAGIIIGIFL